MNDKQRKEIDESNLAMQTAQVLESVECTDQADAATHELGRLLRRSATHDLPESNQALREHLLTTLAAAGDESMVVLKSPLERRSAPVTRRRLWAVLAVGALVFASGWYLYQQHSGDKVLGRSNQIGRLDKDVPSSAIEPNFLSTLDDNSLPGLIVESAEAKAVNGRQSGSNNIDFDEIAKRNSVDQYSVRNSEIVEELQKFDAHYSNVVRGNVALSPSKQQGSNETDFQLVEGRETAEDYCRPMKRKAMLSQSGPARGKQLSASGPEGLDRYSLSQSKGKQNRFQTPPISGAEGGSVNRFKEVTGTPTVVSVADGETVLLGGIKRDQVYFDDSSSRFESKIEQTRGFDYGLPGSQSSREQYAPIYENAFIKATGGAALSTFSIDVDTASYANMRRFLNAGQKPPRDSIRIEELVNYFQYDYPQPKGDDPFSVNMELASCPWDDSHKLLRVGLKGKEVHVKERPATNVVFLIDVSGSMNSTDKLPLLKRGFQMMVKQLGENDRVSIVTYAGNAGVALEPTTGDKTKTINEAIERLTPGGSTHGSAGIELAYKLAQQHFITGGVNKVILATDGDLNVGVTADGALVDLIKQKASEGVFLTVLGFGTGNLKDGKLEKLADNGNGHYAYIDSNREAHRVLVQQLSGSLVTIAKDVKIQIEFNPAEVKSYRLVGYENRMLATEDFADDRKDAGEIGAGHTVTAIYEIEPTGGAAAALVAPQGMKYQVPSAEAPQQLDDNAQRSKLSDAADSGDLATLALRYKQPDESTSKRIEFTIRNEEQSFSSASDDFRFAASVAGFGMLLRDSAHAGSASPQMILEMASQSMGDDTTGYRAEFVDLIRKVFAR